MPDNITNGSSFFWGVDFEYWNYMVIDIIKWLFTVGLFYCTTIIPISYYKGQLYSGVIVKYGSYLKWFIKSLSCIFGICFSIAFLDGILFYRGRWIIGFWMIMLMAFNYICKSMCIFCLSNKTSHNMFVCVFIGLEIFSIYKPKLTIYNPFSWGMMSRSSLACAEGFNVWVAVIVYVIVICFSYIFFRYKSIKK